ncbi:MAG: family transporter [Solirubrobacterales bacterium]|jgi:drug/metabolite transporter (DMT)-like permease|nr:family transporter [Solirubrobacterales bacterium]
MVAIAIALAASCCWGIADFTGGLKSRHLPVPLVLLMVEGTGALAAALVIAATHEPLPGTRAVVYSLVAGTAGIMGLAAFYRALAIGTMSIVAPISATGVALPVIVGIATGDRLSTVVSAGLVVTVAGVILASREQHDGDAGRAAAGRLSIGLALLSAVGFGTYFSLADVAADGSVLWLLLLARVVVLPVMAGAVLISRPPLPSRGDLATLAGAGLLDIVATGLYGVANTKGALSIVSVVGALYPVTTVLLARMVLSERLRPIQAAGIGAAFAGVGLIVAG